MNGDEIPPSTIQAWWKGLERGCYDVDKEELLSLAEPLPTNCKLPTILGALPSETLSTLLLRFSQTKKVKNILPTWWALLDGRSIGEKELKTLQQGNNYNMLYDRIQVGELTLSPQLSAEYKELQSADSRFLSLAKLVETIPYRIQVTLNQKNRYAHQDSTDMGIQIGSSSPISSDSCPASQNERICTFEDDNFTRIVRLGEAVSVDISVNAFGTFPYLQDDERKLEICVVIVNSEVPTVIPEHIAAYARTRGEVDDCTLPYSAREYIVTGKLHCILDMTGKDPITSSDLHGILSSDVQAQETNITEQKSNINADCVNGDQIFAAHHYFELTFLQPGAFSLYTIVRTLGCGDKWSTNPVPTQICATNG